MALNVVINGSTFTIPSPGDIGWGTTLDAFFQAIGTGTLQPSGGSQPLTADIDLGSSFGPLAAYFKSKSASIAASGIMRLAKGDAVSWRNNANSADLALGISAQDALSFNGKDVVGHPMAIYTATSTSVTGATQINFSTLELDTNSAVTTGSSWKFTVPAGKGGVYSVTAQIVFATLPNPATDTISLFKNGSAVRTLYRNSAGAWTANNSFGGTTLISLAAGDFIDVRIGSATGTGTLSATAADNFISIARLTA